MHKSISIPMSISSQIFAPRVPTCMIFIPSINGISHNPAERTNITDLAEGVKTLAL
ncbi:M20/M25/M40 family metallo-hydrolase, partial [Escherichia coli]|uniref:M20/M25/M40 family metallo-hydrolase n=1 Tax=Escherichia coli TaxID=562 RepID=UPI003EE2FAF5